MKPLTFAFIDCETTGVDRHKHGLIQLAGIICKTTDLSVFTEVETFSYLISTFENDEISEEALEINGFTREQIKTFEEPNVTHERLTTLLGKHIDKFNPKDKAFFCGYNVRFDYDFTRRWFEKCRDKYFGSWFWAPPIDVMNLAIVHFLRKRNELENFKLGTVAAALDLKPQGTLHTALTDIDLTKRIFECVAGFQPVEYAIATLDMLSALCSPGMSEEDRRTAYDTCVEAAHHLRIMTRRANRT